MIIAFKANVARLVAIFTFFADRVKIFTIWFTIYYKNKNYTLQNFDQLITEFGLIWRYEFLTNEDLPKKVKQGFLKYDFLKCIFTTIKKSFGLGLSLKD